jgi:hypothetical protein
MAAQSFITLRPEDLGGNELNGVLNGYEPLYQKNSNNPLQYISSVHSVVVVS